MEKKNTLHNHGEKILEGGETSQQSRANKEKVKKWRGLKSFIPLILPSIALFSYLVISVSKTQFQAR